MTRPENRTYLFGKIEIRNRQQASNLLMNIPTIKDDAPYLDTEQMIEVDRAMVDDYRIALIHGNIDFQNNLLHALLSVDR